MKRTICIICLIMLIGVIGFGIESDNGLTDLFAVRANAEVTSSGTCGQNLTWEYDESTNTLTISGTGSMFTYGHSLDESGSNGTNAPWRPFCDEIKRVIIGTGITSIGEYAFYAIDSISSIEIGNDIESISDYAFSSCDGLTIIDIPNSVLTIGNYAFAYCGSLTGITIPDSVTNIGNYSFYECNNLTNMVLGNGIERIGFYAFYHCTSLTNITIPGSVTSVGESAFYGCSGITSLTIGNGVTNIESYAFGNCPITSITIPDSVTSLDSHAFSNCPLEYVKMGSGLTSIPSSLISNKYLKTFIAGKNVKTVSGFSKCKKLTSVTISNGTTTIGDNAFYGCTGLTSIILPDSIKKIGEAAFGDCTGLVNLSLGSGVTVISDLAFCGCSGLNNVVLTKSVKDIGDGAFSGCTGLKSLIIPEGVTNIGYNAFYECSGINEVVIPDSVISIGNPAFPDDTIIYSKANSIIAPSLGNFISPNNNEYKIKVLNGDNDKYIEIVEYIGSEMNVSIPSSVDEITIKSIGSNAFPGNINTASVIIPDSVTNIEKSAFPASTIVYINANTEAALGFGNFISPNNNCFVIKVLSDDNGKHIEIVEPIGLEEYLLIPPSIDGVSVKKIGNNAFSNCIDITSVSIPESITSIGDSAFSDCTGLTCITIPQNVTSIGGYAFSGCTNLKTLNYDAINCSGNGFTSSYNWLYGGHWLNGCNNLEMINIGNQVEIIPQSAFYYCNYFTEINIPNSVTNIGASAFSGCTGLTSIIIPNSVTNIGASAFSECSGLTSIIIPDSVTYINNSVFSNCTNLTNVTFGNGVTYIGSEALSGCEKLKSVAIPDSVNTIGESAFSGCYKLKNLFVPVGVENINNLAFKGIPNIEYSGDAYGSPWGALCVNGYIEDSLVYENNSKNILVACFYDISEDVIIPDGVTNINSYAFSNCNGIKSITVPNSVVSIGIGAFIGCVNLERITLPFVGANRSASDYTGNFGYIFGNHSRNSGREAVCHLTKLGYNESSRDYRYLHRHVPKYSIYDYDLNLIDTGTYEYCETVFSSRLQACSNAYPCSEMPRYNSTVDNYSFSSYRVGIISDNWYTWYVNGWLESYYYTIPLSLKAVTVTDATIINSAAFSNCSSITTIEINNGITTISSSVFHGCSSLTSITIPPSVTIIGNCAFYGCSSLTSITIPDSVTSIGEDAFNSCTGLTGVTIGNGVTNIGGSAFKNCTRLTCVTIPESVTNIGGGAFNNCTGLTSVNWDAVNCLDFSSSSYSPFNSLSGITSFNFGNNVQRIPSYLCYGCAGLKSIIIPESVNTIGDYAFSGCSSLGSVYINSNAAFGSNCFSDCPINKVVMGGSMTEIPKDLIVPDYLKTFEICNGVVIIADSTFADCTRLTSITIPDSVTSIGDEAFKGCNGLTSVTIPERVTSIGEGAFSGCTGLTSITIPDSVTSIGYEAFYNTGYYNNKMNWDLDVLYIGKWLVKAKTLVPQNYEIKAGTFFIADGAFQDIVGIKSIIIPDSITSIGNYAFKNCTGLTGLTIPASVTNIGGSSFSGCTGLSIISIPDSVTSIGDSAFYNCTGLATVNFNAVNCCDSETPFKGCTSITSFSFGNKVQRIPSYLCYGMSELSYIVIPESVTDIGEYAFSGCTGLVGVSIPQNVRIIGENAFSGTNGLYYRGNAEGAPWGSTGITDGLFVYSDVAKTNLKGYLISLSGDVTVPEQVINISGGAFENCAEMTSISFGKGITSIPAGAFGGCTGLKIVSFSENIAEIDSGVFKNINLIDVYYSGTERTRTGIAVGSDNNPLLTATWHYGETYIPAIDSGENPGEAVNPNPVIKGTCGFAVGWSIDTDTWTLYITGSGPMKNYTVNSNPWTPYLGEINNIVIGSGITSIGKYDFYNFVKVRSVNLPEGITSIDEYAFAFCENLSAVSLPKSLQSIGEGAFFITRIKDIYYAGSVADKNNMKIEAFNGFEDAVWHYETSSPVVDGKEYTLSFSANGGSGAPEQIKGSGKTKLPSTMPKRNGYTFIGWSTDKNASAGQYQPVAEFSLTKDTTLYAVWQKNETPTNPSNPDNPTNPSNPSNPDNPTNPTNPSNPDNPTNPTNPTNPDNPTNPSNPAGRDDVAKVKITAPTGTKQLNWKFKAQLVATASGLPSDCHIAWYEGNTKVSDSADYTTGSLTGNHTYTAKIVDSTGKAVSTASQEQSVTVEVKTDFFSKLISFFMRLFGSDVTKL